MADKDLLFFSKSEFGTPNHEIDHASLLPTKAKLVRDFSRVIITLENILIPDEKLSQTPSFLDGVPENVEIDLKVFGSELIQTAGILLDLPQVAMATGQVLFQRFFYCKSFVKHGVEVVAMSCVHLASKIEEAPRRIRDVIAVFHHMKQVRNQKTFSSLVLDHNYINLKNQVIKEERRVLKELGFCVHVKHPHKMIVMYLQVLEAERNRRLLQCAWNYMNDSFRTNVFIRFHPETIACSCIYLAARQLQIALPNNPAWYALFGVLESDIKKICLAILTLYTRAKPNPEGLEKIINELKVQLKSKMKTHTLEASSAPGTPADKHQDSPSTITGSLPSRDLQRSLVHSRSAAELERIRVGGNYERSGKHGAGDRKRRSDEEDRYKNRLDVKSSEKATERLKRSRSPSPSDVSRGRDVKRGRASREESYHSRNNRDAASHSRGGSPVKGSNRSSGITRHDSGHQRISSGVDKLSTDRVHSQAVDGRSRHDKSHSVGGVKSEYKHGSKSLASYDRDSSGRTEGLRHGRHEGSSQNENRSDSYHSSKEISSSKTNVIRDKKHESSKEKRRHVNGSKNSSSKNSSAKLH